MPVVPTSSAARTFVGKIGLSSSGRGARNPAARTRRKPSAPQIRVPAPTCPAPNNHSVWFTKGTQSIKQPPSHNASRAGAWSMGSSASVRAAAGEGSSTVPQTVTCTWERPLPAVVRVEEAHEEGTCLHRDKSHAGDNHHHNKGRDSGSSGSRDSYIRIRWTRI